MTKNKTLIYISLIIVFSAIIITTFLKVNQIHESRMLEVTTKKIVDTAKKCYYNNSCVNNQITLNELYDKMGLQLQTNPVTKKVYNENSYVVVNENFKFVEEK